MTKTRKQCQRPGSGAFWAFVRRASTWRRTILPLQPASHVRSGRGFELFLKELEIVSNYIIISICTGSLMISRITASWEDIPWSAHTTKGKTTPQSKHHICLSWEEIDLATDIQIVRSKYSIQGAPSPTLPSIGQGEIPQSFHKEHLCQCCFLFLKGFLL